jgi:hypothetical protein
VGTSRTPADFNGPGDLVNTDPQLGALRANGGLGLTQVPPSSSPAFGLARPAFCRVTATNVGGTTVATSAAVVAPKPPVQLPTAPAAPPAVVVQLAAPVATVRPALTGTLRTGLQATCSPGSFTGAASTAVTWLRNGAPIAGATAATYTPTASDAGEALQCAVAATGRGGTTRAESAPAVPAKACVVPALVGQTRAAARRRLVRANCALGRTTRRRSAKRSGRVLAASPAKGRNLAAGSRIALTIAKR